MQLRCLKNQKHARQCNPIVKDYLDANLMMRCKNYMQELWKHRLKEDLR